MRKDKRRFSLLILSILSFISLLYVIVSFPPEASIIVLGLKIPILIPWFLILFIFLYSLFGFLLNKRRGLLAGLFMICYLILKLNGLTHPFFLLLLIVLFLMTELFFVKRK